VFAGLTRDLVPLIKAISESGKKPDRSVLERDFPVERQRMFAEAAAVAFGFDFAAGRLDTTAHPFCRAIQLDP
jgi:carboxypeptidase Taq